MSKGITQKDLASFFNMSPGNLCDWEKGRSEPDIETLIKLADFFGESIDYLVGRVDEDTPVPTEPVSRSKQHLIYMIRVMSDKNVKSLLSAAEALRKKEDGNDGSDDNDDDKPPDSER